MTARSSRSYQVGFAVVLVMCGLLIAGAGVWQLRLIERTHQSQDILYPASPRVFQVWIKTLDYTDRDSVRRISDRLLLMNLPQRRDAVVAIGKRQFFSDIETSSARQRAVQELMLAATVEALARAPALGDLWYLAGRLRSQLYGLDAVSQRYLELSYLNAPREVDIVLARLEAMGLGWQLLSERSREIIRQDMAVVREAYPARAAELREFLQRAGAEL